MKIPADFFAKHTQAEFISIIVDNNLLSVSPIEHLDDMRRAFEAQGNDWADALGAVEAEIAGRCVDDVPYCMSAEEEARSQAGIERVQQRGGRVEMPIINLERVRADCLKLYTDTGSKIDCIKYLRKELDIPLLEAKQLFEMEYDPAARAARRLRDDAPDLVEALKEGRRAIGDHNAPDDCYATGPVTGDPFRDLVQCPACSFIAMYERVMAKAGVA